MLVDISNINNYNRRKWPIARLVRSRRQVKRTEGEEGCRLRVPNERLRRSA